MNFSKIGFIQGRLSPIIDGKIQCFPAQYWEEEIAIASKNEFKLIEWTLDHDDLYENPLINITKHEKIKELCRLYNMQINSVTGDFFMQVPFYKNNGGTRLKLIDDLKYVIDSCIQHGVKILVLPLVDQGSINNEFQQDDLIETMNELQSQFNESGFKIAFESDYSPEALSPFMSNFSPVYFGINYDIGNSASLGYNCVDEISIYGDRIINVHVKDRKYKGATVPLGDGDANLSLAIKRILLSEYTGNFILQTARSQDGRHLSDLCIYREMLNKWIDLAWL